MGLLTDSVSVRLSRKANSPALDHSAGTASAALGLVLYCLGFADQALARSSSAIAEARRLAHPPTLASSLVCVAEVLSLVGDNAALDERVDELAAVVSEQSFALFRAQAMVFPRLGEGPIWRFS